MLHQSASSRPTLSSREDDFNQDRERGLLTTRPGSTMRHISRDTLSVYLRAQYVTTWGSCCATEYSHNSHYGWFRL